VLRLPALKQQELDLAPQLQLLVLLPEQQELQQQVLALELGLEQLEQLEQRRLPRLFPVLFALLFRLAWRQPSSQQPSLQGLEQLLASLL